MLSPEMTVTLYVIVIGMLLWRFLCDNKGTSSWSSTVTRTTWTMTSTSSTAAETQTEKEPETSFGALRTENLRLQEHCERPRS